MAAPRELPAELHLVRVAGVVVDDDPQRARGPDRLRGRRAAGREPRQRHEQGDRNVHVGLEELVLDEADQEPGSDGGGARDSEQPVGAHGRADRDGEADDEHEERGEGDHAARCEQLEVDVVRLVRDARAEPEERRVLDVGARLQQQMLALVVAARRRRGAPRPQQHVGDPRRGEDDGNDEDAYRVEEADRRGEQAAAGAGDVDPRAQEGDRGRAGDPPARRTRQPERGKRDRDRAHHGDVVRADRQPGLASHRRDAERVLADPGEPQLVADGYEGAREPGEDPEVGEAPERAGRPRGERGEQRQREQAELELDEVAGVRRRVGPPGPALQRRDVHVPAVQVRLRRRRQRRQTCRERDPRAREPDPPGE